MLERSVKKFGWPFLLEIVIFRPNTIFAMSGHDETMLNREHSGELCSLRGSVANFRSLNDYNKPARIAVSYKLFTKNPNSLNRSTTLRTFCSSMAM